MVRDSHNVIDARYTTEKPKRNLIWADRLAIGMFVLVVGLLFVIATPPAMSVPTIFSAALFVSLPTWLLCRIADFIVTGNFRFR